VLAPFAAPRGLVAAESPALVAAKFFENARLARLAARGAVAPTLLSAPNAITLSGYASAVAWLGGASPAFAVWSVMADEFDGVSARNLGQTSGFGDRLDWGADLCLFALVGAKIGLGWVALPLTLFAQVFMKEHGLAPPFGSARAGLMVYALLL